MNSERLRNIISKKSNGNSDISQKFYQLFYFERISKSRYKGQIILKGGLLLTSIIGDDERTTKDMDATLKGISLTIPEIEKVFNEILSIDLDDGVSFEIVSIKDIRLEDEYGGFRLNILSKLDKNKTYTTVELTTVDIITPREMKYSYKCIFENIYLKQFKTRKSREIYFFVLSKRTCTYTLLVMTCSLKKYIYE